MKDIKPKLEDLLGPEGSLDITSMFDESGRIDTEKLEVLTREKPVIPPLLEGRQKQLSVKINRDRYSEFPKTLPTMDMLPLPPDEHEHIGLYESKQNLYLLLAHAYNLLMERCDKLEEQIEALSP